MIQHVVGLCVKVELGERIVDAFDGLGQGSIDHLVYVVLLPQDAEVDQETGDTETDDLRGVPDSLIREATAVLGLPRGSGRLGQGDRLAVVVLGVR